MLGQVRSALVSQERIVLLTAVALFCVFSVFLKGFLSAGNIVTLVRGVATLGILGVGMAIVVIGRGVDLAIVTTYAMSAAWTLHLASLGVAIPAGAAAWISAGADDRRDQRRVDRLCRDPRALRHSRHGVAGLRLRSLGSRSPLRRLLAAERRCHRVDRRRFRLGRADADPVFRPHRLPRLCVPALHQTGAVHLRDRRQFRGGAHFRRAGASDHRPAIHALCVDRLCRRHDHRDRGLQHEHRRRELPP